MAPRRLDGAHVTRLSARIGASETSNVSMTKKTPTRLNTRQSSSVTSLQVALLRNAWLRRKLASQTLTSKPSKAPAATSKPASLSNCFASLASGAPSDIRIASSRRRPGARASRNRLVFAAATNASRMLPARNS